MYICLIIKININNLYLVLISPEACFHNIYIVLPFDPLLSPNFWEVSCPVWLVRKPFWMCISPCSFYSLCIYQSCSPNRRVWHSDHNLCSLCVAVIWERLQDWGSVRDQECVQLISLFKHMNEGSRRQMAKATNHPPRIHSHTISIRLSNIIVLLDLLKILPS